MSADATRQSLKREHRARLRALRRAIDDSTRAAAAEAAARILRDQPQWSAAQHLGLYLANDGEVPTTAIARHARSAGKELYLPVVDGKQLLFRRWRADGDLVANRYGIEEPPPSAPIATQLDLLIMPVVAWASDGSRLGMGGGFYDRFFARDTHREIWRVGFAYESQRDEQLPSLQESWDQKLHAVVTERAFYDFSS